MVNGADMAESGSIAQHAPPPRGVKSLPARLEIRSVLAAAQAGGIVGGGSRAAASGT